MAAQQGKLTQPNDKDSPTPKLTKAKTLAVFAKQKELSLDHMRTLTTRGLKEEPVDQTEMMLNMMVD